MEVAEETGIACRPEQLLAVIDGQRMGFTRFAMYMLLFHCTATGGELTPHPLETADVGWFVENCLPPGTVGVRERTGGVLLADARPRSILPIP